NQTIALANRSISTCEISHCSQHQAHRGLGNGIRIHARRICDDDPKIPSGIKIDIVEPCTALCNDLELGAALHGCAVPGFQTSDYGLDLPKVVPQIEGSSQCGTHVLYGLIAGFIKEINT